MSDDTTNNGSLPERGPGPRSVKDFVTDDDLLQALSRTTEQQQTVVVAAADASSNHWPFPNEPNAEIDMDWKVNNVDLNKSYEQTVDREMERLRVLKSYLELDYEALTARDCAFDRLSGLAKSCFNAPLCFVFLLDIGRSWALCQEGKQFNLVPRKDTFCSHVIVSQEECFVVPDASKDERFKDSAFVKAENGVRFYAACPLQAPEGVNIGTFCFIDVEPRDDLSSEDRKVLKEFAKLTMDALVYQRELHRKRRELEVAARKLASASHDLLTPLSVVQLSLSLLNEDDRFLNLLDEAQRDCLNTVASSCSAMGCVCEALKIKHSDVCNHVGSSAESTTTQTTESETVISVDAPPSKSESLMLPPSVIKTSSLVSRLNDLASTAMASKKIPLSISIDQSVPESWIGNEVQLLHICLHLLVNSVERTDHTGAVNFHIRINESGACGQELVFECSERGRTPPPLDSTQSLNSIFEERVLSSFSIDAHAEKERCNKGGRASPLGILSGCPTIGSCNMYEGFPDDLLGSQPGLDPFSVQIRSLGGSFGVTNEIEEVGCPSSQQHIKFWFTVPLVVPDEAKLQGGASAQKGKRALCEELSCKHTKYALVVDDSMVMRKMLCRALEQIGFESYHAADGMEGLKMMQERKFDIVLLDFLMPVMDGMDCVREYRKWESQHRPGYRQLICGMSAHASSSDVDRGLKLGLSEYRPKPFNLEELRELKKTCLLNHRAQLASVNDSSPTLKSIERPHQSHKRTSSGSVVPSSASSLHPGQKVCLVVTCDKSKKLELEGAICSTGWHCHVAHSEDEALNLLKARNWGAVMIDIDMPEMMNGLECIPTFREWEKHNRVHRQKNLLIMGEYVKSWHENEQTLNLVQLPAGVDGAVDKPKSKDELASILKTLSDQRNTFEEEDIVTSC